MKKQLRSINETVAVAGLQNEIRNLPNYVRFSVSEDKKEQLCI